jgi:FkbM family methyltransferase
MSIKKILKQIIRTTGYDLTRQRPKPRSGEYPSLVEPYHEISRFLKWKRKPILFDVGAHYGQTTLELKKRFPESTIHAFEPFSESFKKYTLATRNLKGISANQSALGKKTTKLSLNVNKLTATSSLLRTDDRAFETWNLSNVAQTVSTEIVDVSTLDEYLANNTAIEEIDLLKIDAQGSEYDILEGAAKTAEKGLIKLLYMEIIVMPTYEGQRDLSELLAKASQLGFLLHNFYNPCYTNDGRLNQLDALFSKESLAKTN